MQASNQPAEQTGVPVRLPDNLFPHPRQPLLFLELLFHTLQPETLLRRMSTAHRRYPPQHEPRRQKTRAGGGA
eukprot:COSAG01_NODE_47156_length_393_cov_0.704082_1_plen_72_part_10